MYVLYQEFSEFRIPHHEVRGCYPYLSLAPRYIDRVLRNLHVAGLVQATKPVGLLYSGPSSCQILIHATIHTVLNSHYIFNIQSQPQTFNESLSEVLVYQWPQSLASKCWLIRLLRDGIAERMDRYCAVCKYSV